MSYWVGFELPAKVRCIDINTISTYSPKLRQMRFNMVWALNTWYCSRKNMDARNDYIDGEDEQKWCAKNIMNQKGLLLHPLLCEAARLNCCQNKCPPSYVCWFIIPINYRYNPLINPSEIVLINQLNANELGHHLAGCSLSIVTSWSSNMAEIHSREVYSWKTSN